MKKFFSRKPPAFYGFLCVGIGTSLIIYYKQIFFGCILMCLGYFLLLDYDK